MSLEPVIRSIDAEISKLQQAKAILAGRGVTARDRTRRRMSAAAKSRIAAAQRARRARAKAAQKRK